MIIQSVTCSQVMYLLYYCVFIDGMSVVYQLLINYLYWSSYAIYIKIMIHYSTPCMLCVCVNFKFLSVISSSHRRVHQYGQTAKIFKWSAWPPSCRFTLLQLWSSHTCTNTSQEKHIKEEQVVLVVPFTVSGCRYSKMWFGFFLCVFATQMCTLNKSE